MAQLKKIKSVENATLYNDAQGNPLIRIDNCRLSFPFLGTPGEDEDDNGNKKKSWRVVAMMPKDTHEAAHALIEKTIKDLIASNDTKVSPDKWFMTDGDEKEREEMEGHWCISASDGRIRPTARNRRQEVMDDIAKIDEMFYGGCWAHVLIRPWYFAGKTKNSPKTFPKRISAGLNAVMFAKDDKPFGSGRIDDEDAWDGIESSDDDDDDGL